MSTLAVILSTVAKQILYFTVLSVISIFDLNPGLPGLFSEEAEQVYRKPALFSHGTTSSVPADSRYEQRYGISAVLQAVGVEPEAGPAVPSLTEEMAAESRWWPEEVKKNIARETGSPLDLMRIDRYYWLHYLVEVEPEIE